MRISLWNWFAKLRFDQVNHELVKFLVEIFLRKIPDGKWLHSGKSNNIFGHFYVLFACVFKDSDFLFLKNLFGPSFSFQFEKKIIFSKIDRGFFETLPRSVRSWAFEMCWRCEVKRRSDSSSTAFSVEKSKVPHKRVI